MKISTRILLAASLSFSSLSHAHNECDQYRTTYDRTYCMSKIFIESDKELNETYKSLTNIIPSDVKKSLVQTQRQWIKYRDRECQPESGTINVDCSYRVNKTRTDYLRDRLRECKAGTCRHDMITLPNW